MTALPYSVRDLRSVFHTQTLTRDFFGDYDHETRRWRFSNADSCREAQAFLDKAQVHLLHAPGASRLVDGIRVRGGFSVLARNEEGANKHGTAFYLFKTADERFDATKFLYSQLAANDDLMHALESALKKAPKDLFAERTPGAIVAAAQTRRPWTHEANVLIARAQAGMAARPKSAVDERTSRAQCVQLAQQYAGNFAEEAAPENGEIVGLLVGRSAHHLAVQTNEDGRGVILDRWRISTPLRQQYAVERAFDVGSAMHVNLKGGAGDALQIRGERDLTYGSIMLRGLRAAERAGVLPIVQTEDYAREDLRGSLVASDETIGVVLDDGGYLVAGRADDFIPRDGSTRVEMGPTWKAGGFRQQLARAASR
jgi:hypothetical protein